MSANATVRIDNLDDHGRGVAKINGKATFIEGALPNELVSYEIIEDKKRFSIAECRQIIEPSEQRVSPPCPVFAQCGGCQLQHLSIDAQRSYKQNQWISQLERLGQVTPASVLEPLIGEPWHYRHRARLTVSYQHDVVVLGFKAAKSHSIIDTDSCLVLSQQMSSLLSPIKGLLNTLLPFKVHEVELHEGENAIAIGLSLQDSASDKVALTEKLNAWKIKQQTKLDKPMQLWVKENKGGYKAFSPLDASLYYDLPYEGLAIAYTPNDFTQINHVMNREMVRLVMQALAPATGERIADLFCGLGNFSFPLAKLGAKVLSVEGVTAMVSRLQKQAEVLGLAAQIKAIRQDLFRVNAAQINSWGQMDKWLLDPPRAGAKELIDVLPKKKYPQKIVYVSCNPATLARDAKLLVDKGYQFIEGQMIDLFPQTAHIESINVFER